MTKRRTQAEARAALAKRQRESWPRVEARLAEPEPATLPSTTVVDTGPTLEVNIDGVGTYGSEPALLASTRASTSTRQGS